MVYRKPYTATNNDFSIRAQFLSDLVQRHGDNLKRIGYCSRSLTKSERHWTQIEKELLAELCGLEKLHIFLCGLKYTLETDHKPHVPLINCKDLNDAPIRCQRLLTAYRHRDTFDPGTAYIYKCDLFVSVMPHDV